MEHMKLSFVGGENMQSSSHFGNCFDNVQNVISDSEFQGIWSSFIINQSLSLSPPSVSPLFYNS